MIRSLSTDVDETIAPAAPAVILPPKVPAKKWADEDAEDNDNVRLYHNLNKLWMYWRGPWN